jgi:hypothetical protein
MVMAGIVDVFLLSYHRALLLVKISDSKYPHQNVLLRRMASPHDFAKATVLGTAELD